MEVICLETEAFYALVDEVVKRLRDAAPEKWVTTEKAMELLNIKSKSTLQILRDEGKLRFTHPQKKIILYDRDSINEYLEKHARETF